MLPGLRPLAQVPERVVRHRARHVVRRRRDAVHHPQHGLFGRRTSRHERGSQTHAGHRQQGLHLVLHPGSRPETVGAEQGVLRQRMEHLRPDHRHRQSDRLIRGERQRDLRPARHETRKLTNEPERD